MSSDQLRHNAVNDALERRRLANAAKRAAANKAKRAAAEWPLPPVGFGQHVREADDIAVAVRVEHAVDLVNNTGEAHPSEWKKVVDNLRRQLQDIKDPDGVIAFLLGKGLRYVDWDGITPRRIVDSADRRIVAALGGRPMTDDTWPQVYENAGALLEAQRPKLGSPPDKDRGQFYQLLAGPSYGGGQAAPQQKAHTAAQAKVAEALSTSPDFQRIAGFQNSVAATFQPNACRLGQETHSALRAKYGEALNGRFCRGIWSGVAWNFPPDVVCVPHRDSQNPPGFPCTVSTGGHFDSSRGGMIVLWNLNIFVRFPPCSTIILTSGDCTHFNVPVHPGEQRWSMTQYMTGPLITWVRRGFRKRQDMSKEEQAEEAREARERAANGRRIYSTTDGLQGDYQQLKAGQGSFL